MLGNSDHTIGHGEASMFFPVTQMFLPNAGGVTAPCQAVTILETGTSGSAPRVNLPVAWFDATSNEQIYLPFSFPHNWDWQWDSYFDVRIHWISSGTGTGNVRWQMWSRGFEDGDTTITSMFENYEIEDAANGTQYEYFRSGHMAFEDIPFGIEDGSYALLAIEREADHTNDTYTEDAGLIGVEIRYWQRFAAGDRHA
jgi:hypothetical protein